MKRKRAIVMKKTAAMLTAVIILIVASGCGGGQDTGESIADENIQAEEAEKSETEEAEMRKISISAGGREFTASIYENETTEEFLKMLPTEKEISELNGNEKYYYTDRPLPTAPERVGDINAGDIMLYGSDCIVLFYESFSTGYSYTRIGHIDDPEGLAGALGGGSVKVSFSVI